MVSQVYTNTMADQVGCAIRVNGLMKNPQMNGMVGVVRKYDELRGRMEIQVGLTGEHKSIKLENLSAVSLHEELSYLRDHLAEDQIDAKKATHILDRLEEMSLTVDILKRTQVGRVVNELTKRVSGPDYAGTIQKATQLVRQWRELYVASSVASPFGEPENPESASAASKDSKPTSNHKVPKGSGVVKLVEQMRVASTDATRSTVLSLVDRMSVDLLPVFLEAGGLSIMGQWLPAHAECRFALLTILDKMTATKDQLRESRVLSGIVSIAKNKEGLKENRDKARAIYRKWQAEGVIPKLPPPQAPTPTQAPSASASSEVPAPKGAPPKSTSAAPARPPAKSTSATQPVPKGATLGGGAGATSAASQAAASSATPAAKPANPPAPSAPPARSTTPAATPAAPSEPAARGTTPAASPAAPSAPPARSTTPAASSAASPVPSAGSTTPPASTAAPSAAPPARRPAPAIRGTPVKRQRLDFKSELARLDQRVAEKILGSPLLLEFMQKHQNVLRSMNADTVRFLMRNMNRADSELVPENGASGPVADRTVMLSSLDDNVTEADVIALLKRCSLKHDELILPRESRKRRTVGVCYVIFSTAAEAERAVMELKGQEITENHIVKAELQNDPELAVLDVEPDNDARPRVKWKNDDELWEAAVFEKSESTDDFRRSQAGPVVSSSPRSTSTQQTFFKNAVMREYAEEKQNIHIVLD